MWNGCRCAYRESGCCSILPQVVSRVGTSMLPEASNFKVICRKFPSAFKLNVCKVFEFDKDTKSFVTHIPTGLAHNWLRKSNLSGFGFVGDVSLKTSPTQNVQSSQCCVESPQRYHNAERTIFFQKLLGLSCSLQTATLTSPV